MATNPLHFSNVTFTGAAYTTKATLPAGWPLHPGTVPAGALKASLAAVMAANAPTWQAAGQLLQNGKPALGTVAYYQYCAVYCAMVAGAPVCPANNGGHTNANGAIGNRLGNGPGRLAQHAYWHYGQALPLYHAALLAQAAAQQAAAK